MTIVEFPDLGLEFLAEGAANVVYRIVSPSRTPSVESETLSIVGDEADGSNTPAATEIMVLHIDPRVQGKLVRLRKDIPTAISIVEAQDGYEKHIKPHFREDELVEQVTTRLAPYLIEKCNTELERMEIEGTRSQRRFGVFLRTSDCYGTLVTDMSPDENQNVFTFEFKPKWLVQSPSAPRGAKRCRTCALRAMRTAEHSTDSFTSQVLCPLGLLSNEEETVKSTISGLLVKPTFGGLVHELGHAKPETLERVVKFLHCHPIILELKRLQTEMDPNGVFEGNVTSQDYLTAMTLRDCTLFLKVPLDGESPGEARIGDLDIKSPSKAEYWKSLEQQLIDGGWYMGTEEHPVAELAKCSLWED